MFVHSEKSIFRKEFNNLLSSKQNKVSFLLNMFNSGPSIRDLYNESSSDDEYFSSTESDVDKDEIMGENLDDSFNFSGYDSDLFESSDSESDGDFDFNDQNGSDSDNENDNDNFYFSLGATLKTALILWAVSFGISHTALSALLLILKRFGHNELPKLARTLLRTPRKAIEPRPCAPGEFYYRGIEYNLFFYNDEFFNESDTVQLDFFIDGLSVSESSKVKMWPIMGSFVNQPFVEPFVIGCYSGSGDPIDVDDFMKEFVEEIKRLQKNGVRVTKNQTLKQFQFRCFIADGPARAFATGTMSHSSYFGCPKCDQVCYSEGHKLYYQYFVGELRTDESFRQRTDVLHHKPKFQNRPSLLEGVMGMVSQVVIEAMHAVDHGVTKRVVKAIFSNDSLCSRVTKASFDTFQARFKLFRSYVPSDFARKPRTLTEIAYFKAAEFRQMLLYTLPVLLKGVVSPQLYSHVLKLHIAIRLLSDPSKYMENIEAARALITEFVDQYDASIGKKHFTYYTHCLLHIPDFVAEYGPLYSFSAYKYENHMRVIKRLLRRKHGHLKQFFNRIDEIRYADELRSEMTSINGKQSKFNSFKLQANSLKDGCCMLSPGVPLVITKLFMQNGIRMVRGYRFQQCKDFYDDPVPSMENVGTILASNLSTSEEDFPASSILYKFFRLPYEDEDVLIPLLHLG